MGRPPRSYLRRPAAANHRRFSHLRRYLATPRGSYSPIEAGSWPSRQAARPHAILRAFPELGPAAAAGQHRTRIEVLADTQYEAWRVNALRDADGFRVISMAGRRACHLDWQVGRSLRVRSS